MNIVYLENGSLKLGPMITLACGLQLLVVLDGLILTVALPDIQSALNLSALTQSWLLGGYLVTFGGLLLLAARLADHVGHRRIILSGLAIFVAASLIAGLATNGVTMVIARIAQGAGAAALAPASLSVLTRHFNADRRTRALSIWSATSAAGGVLGLVLGGLITSTLGWRWVLLINVPIGVALAIIATLVPGRHCEVRRLDIPGAIAVTLCAASATFAASQLGVFGWTSPYVLIAAGTFAVMLFVAIAVERRSPSPLVNPRVVRRPGVIVGNTVLAAMGVIMTATTYFLSLYLQGVRGYPAWMTGLALGPMSVALGIGAIASRKLMARFGAWRLLLPGSGLMSAGLLWLATITPHSGYISDILGPTLIWGAGASIVTMPIVWIATAGVAVEDAGLASGLVNTSRQLGGALGLAALTALAASVAHDSAAVDVVVDGYRVAFRAAAALAALIGITAAFARRSVAADEATSAPPIRSTLEE
ncbi:MFS transporter [Cumulibacter soli]|uniref:MFS transporter n=1 Tax=Cumulibacter soli TaxID=2546344 RepID=UPI001067D50B|nr:MFS transporter [Cumulibacter soli]